MKYLCDPHIIPTVVPDSAAHMEKFLHSSTYATEVHIDVVDGEFAPNTTWPIGASKEAWGELSSFIKSSDKRVGVHLMTASPLEHGTLFASAGAHVIVGHIEAFEDRGAVPEALAAWRSGGAEEVGVALLIDTPLEVVDDSIASCDLVHLMSISRIGTQGIPYDDRVLQRIEELHAKYPDMMVQVDGGIDESNIEDIVRAGANRLCIGSAISSAADSAAAFATLHERAMRGCTPLRVAEVV